jgi:uncharacterized membrane protein YvbJ
MSYCPKCGNKVDETMTFCPNCGNSLKMEAPSRPAAPVAPSPTYRRNEKNEKNEKQEKNQQNEKREKNEKGESGFIGWLIGGIIIIIVGVFAYARAMGFITSPVENALVLLIIGIAVIFIALWLSMRARRRSPAPPV